MLEYYVVGDFEIANKRIESCLISVCGTDKARAEQSLAYSIANPPKGCLGNIHIKSEQAEQCWWNMGHLD